MKKHLFLTVLTAAALVGCSDEVATGGRDADAGHSESILFNGGAPRVSRGATTGADAAALLGGEFRVFGTYTKNGSTAVVFDNYVVQWDGNIDSNETDKHGWNYLGLASKGTTPVSQEVKYWDLQASRYDFVAFAGIPDDKVIVSTTSNNFQVDAASMYSLYISDHRIASATGNVGAEAGGTTVMYGKTVDFTFSRMTTRVRFGFYETIPGYAITNLRFYYGDNATTSALSTKTAPGLRGSFAKSGQYSISYGDLNQPVADLQPSGSNLENALVFDKLKLTTAQSSVIATPALYLDEAGNAVATGSETYMSTTSAAPTYAVCAANIDGVSVPESEWMPILPYTKDISTQALQKANNLVLRVDFDLVPLDGSKAIINIYNASAVVPAAWAQWKPNYAYTYIFKITDAIKGSTTPPETDPVDPNEPDPDPDDPAITSIVFDASVSAVEDCSQQTITQLTGDGANAITTYSVTSHTSDQGEYAQGDEICLSSFSSGRWSIAYTDVEPDRNTIANAYDSFTWTVLAGGASGNSTIDQNATSTATFTADKAGYYVVELRYLPAGRVDSDENYVNSYKIIRIHQ